MNPWSDDAYELLLTARSEQEVFDFAIKTAHSIGFEYCAYGMRAAIPLSRPKVALFSNYSLQWQERYRERGYLQVDPTVRHAFTSTMPVVWSNELFASAPELWEEARGHGLKAGWAQASRDARGTLGLLTLARGDKCLDEKELRAQQPAMAWLSQLCHAAMTSLLLPKLMPQTLVTLTPREKEILLWTAEGKTSYEIAQILGIAERTANFHIANVVTKLGASNKTHAAAIAASIGLLF